MSWPAWVTTQMVGGAGNKCGIIDYTNTNFHNSLVVKHGDIGSLHTNKTGF